MSHRTRCYIQALSHVTPALKRNQRLSIGTPIVLVRRHRVGADLDRDARFSNYFEIGFTETHFLLDFCQAYGDERPILQARIAVVTADALQLLSLLREVLVQYRERFPESSVGLGDVGYEAKDSVDRGDG